MKKPTRISEFIKVTRYETDIQKLTVFLYTNNELKNYFFEKHL